MIRNQQNLTQFIFYFKPLRPKHLIGTLQAHTPSPVAHIPSTHVTCTLHLQACTYVVVVCTYTYSYILVKNIKIYFYIRLYINIVYMILPWTPKISGPTLHRYGCVHFAAGGRQINNSGTQRLEKISDVGLPRRTRHDNPCVCPFSGACYVNKALFSLVLSVLTTKDYVLPCGSIDVVLTMSELAVNHKLLQVHCFFPSFLRKRKRKVTMNVQCVSRARKLPQPSFLEETKFIML
jgi:hypothetical protein